MKPHDFAGRRARAFEAIGPSAAVVLGAAPELRVGDTELRYVVDPDVWYLTGHVEPETVAVLRRAGDERSFTLFVRPRDPARELWTGERVGVEAAVERHGADEAFPITELGERLPDLLSGCDDVYARLDDGQGKLERLIVRSLVDGRRTRARTGRGPCRLVDPAGLLGPMRLRKDAAELEAMREAARITVESFAAAAPLIRTGAGEWEIEAAIDGGFRSRGASGPAFPTIAASGPNATVLHHTANDRRIARGEMLLLDAGARSAMYCADITRTFPTTKRFAGVGRSAYDVVLAAHDAAITAAKPGCTIADVHSAALRILVRGMVDLGLVAGDIDGLIEEQEQVARFYPHRTSHWLGLDVHDVGSYVTSDGKPVVLEPGMVFTVEPGLYVPRDTEGQPRGLAGTGVRIEDDVLITPDGNEVLTGALPVAPEDVAAMRAG